MAANWKAASGSLPGMLVPAGPVIGLGFGLIWSTLLSWGSELSTNAGDYAIENWQVEQGLPHISITSIAQTPDGYLWLGTFNGLTRFDGVQFTVFDEGNTPVLGNSGITHLQVDELGALWIVTLAGGLVRMTAGQFTVALSEDAPLLLGEGEFSNDPSRRLLLRDRKGRWHQIERGQLIRLDSAQGARARDEPRFLFENSGGTWIAQRGSVVRSSETSLSLPGGDGSDSNRLDSVISSAAASRSGGYWVAMETGIYRLRQGKLSTRVAPLPSGIRQPMSLKEDGQGDLWAGKWGQGLYRLKPDGSWEMFGAQAGLVDNYVNCLFRDREGNLWVGTFQGGLHRIRPRVFQMYKTDRGAGSDVVMSVTEDRHGRMWFGVNGGGLHTWAAGKLDPVIEPAVLRSYPLAYSVLADGQDAIWVGLYGRMALRLSAGEVTPYQLDDESGQAMTPHALLEDHAGAVWLGCTHGLLRYQNGQFKRFTSREGLSCDTVLALAEDRSGTLFIGTGGGGLNCLRKGEFTHYTEHDGLADNHISSLFLDQEQTLWIGTVNGGVSRFQHGRFVNFTVKSGLPSNTIGTLLEDDCGNLWLGSNRGIIRVSRKALNDYADKKGDAVAWHVFGLSDGLSTIGCTGGSQPASWKAHDGKLWFATVKGVTVVDPNHLPFNSLPPPVVIEEVVMDDRAQAVQSATPVLTIPPRNHRFAFRFTGLSLAAPEKVRFRYRLEPFDEDWIQAGTRRIAYYSRVRPGSYQFRVTACNNDGVWNETGAVLGFVVLPPWWMTWWFRALTVLGVAGLFFGWYEHRLYRLRHEHQAQEGFSRRLIVSQENERRRLAGELHDGLGQDLLVIACQAQLSLSQPENPPATAARLKAIAETARQAIQQARLMAHNLRPGLLEELGFTKAIRASADKAAQASGISIAVALQDIDGLLPPEFEINFFRIIQESMNNVLKHASASEAKITLTKNPAGLRLVVEDNGRGFEPSRLDSARPEQRGFGLRQIAERAKMMGGRVELQSQAGQGTRLVVEVPVKASCA